MASIHIRNVTIGDFDDVYRLLQQLWPDKQFDKIQTQVAFERGLQEDIYICAEEQQRVIGFCSIGFKNSLWEDGQLAYISELVVDDDVRGSGVGTLLMRRAIHLARERGCQRIELDSALHRSAAHRFYEALGFDGRAYLFSLKLDEEDLL